jgi:hypothetical protein
VSRIFRPSSTSGIASAWCWLFQRHYSIAEELKAGVLRKVKIAVVEGRLEMTCRRCGEVIE